MNAVAKVALGGLGLGATGLGYRIGSTLVDNKKGSLTNRADCAAEKIKNDTSATLKLAVPVSAGIEVSVAATKSYIAQLTSFYLLAPSNAVG